MAPVAAISLPPFYSMSVHLSTSHEGSVFCAVKAHTCVSAPSWEAGAPCDPSGSLTRGCGADFSCRKPLPLPLPLRWHGLLAPTHRDAKPGLETHSGSRNPRATPEPPTAGGGVPGRVPSGRRAGAGWIRSVGHELGPRSADPPGARPRLSLGLRSPGRSLTGQTHGKCGWTCVQGGLPGGCGVSTGVPVTTLW